MFARLGDASMSLDVGTLFVVATCVTSLLGLFLLFAWMQDRVRALAWWGAAYLIGGFSVAIWSVDDADLAAAAGRAFANALLFVACGMIWNAARLFHGRPVLWGAMSFGAAVWLVACVVAGFRPLGRRAHRPELAHRRDLHVPHRRELWRERRKSLIRRWPAIFVPMLHGAIFLFPVPLASLLPDDGGMISLATGWIAVFALEIMLYVVGTAFIVLVHVEGPRGAPLQDGGRDRSADRRAQPARLPRSGARGHGSPRPSQASRSAC